MIYKYLGNTQIRIPALIQGITGTGNHSDYNPTYVGNRLNVIQHGIDRGMTFLDTAEIYGGGLSEEIIGRAVKGQREKVVIASKCYPHDNARNNIVSSLEGSLKRLQTDYIDLYQIHWPNPFVNLMDILETLSILVDQGKIRYIGLSNYTLSEFIEAQNLLPNQTIVSTQIEFNLLNRTIEDDFIPYSKVNKITLMTYSPLNQGRLFHCDKQKRLLKSLSKKYNKSISQVVLRWIISHDNVVTSTRTRSIEHLIDNASAMDFDIEKKDLQRISKLTKTECSYVATDRIKIRIEDNRALYTNVNDALENKLQLIPSPKAISKLLIERNAILPIRLVPTKDTSGEYNYDIDSYDTNDNLKRYWGWIIAYGYNRNIPAYILS
jgi:aryl-alcohol dehydrogenase-like predicted oxidoreductase